MFKRYCDGDHAALPSALRGGTYGIVLANGGDAEFDALVNLYKTTTSEEEKWNIIGNFGAVTTPHLVQRTLDTIFTPLVKDQDVRQAFSYIICPICSLFNRFIPLYGSCALALRGLEDSGTGQPKIGTELLHPNRTIVYLLSWAFSWVAFRQMNRLQQPTHSSAEKTRRSTTKPWHEKWKNCEFGTLGWKGTLARLSSG